MSQVAAWRVLGRSVRGAAHVRSGMPNQDAIGWLPSEGAELPLVVAVADGHGGAKSFRSDRGARLAVEALLAECAALLGTAPGERRLSAIKRLADEHLPQSVLRRWSAEVDRDLAERPFEAVEFEALERKDGPRARQRVEAAPQLAYGTTLLATVVGPEFLLYLQLGDGDILTVSEAGEVERPLGQGPLRLGNETASLCSPDAVREFRVAFEATVGGAAPALILLATDGYANSFRDDASFLQVGADLLGLLRDEGVDEVAGKLEGWLSEASALGSGDDITLGLVCRTTALGGARRGGAPGDGADAGEKADAGAGEVLGRP